MGELKSAWEIAQEKADRLGKLSAEEIQRQREQECRQIGRAIAQRYLDSPESLSLALELDKYQDKKDLVRQASLTHLTQAIDLKSWSGTSPDATVQSTWQGAKKERAHTATPLIWQGAKKERAHTATPLIWQGACSGGVYPRLEKIAQGIATLEPKSQPLIERIRELAQEYEHLADKTRRAIEIKCRGTLHQLRISGTAVGNINIEATPQWQQNWHSLTELFEPRLDSLKQELINSISSV